MPIASDLVKLTKKIVDVINGELGELKSYAELVLRTISGLILFNRRPMEVAELKVTDYRFSLALQEDRVEVLDNLSVEEKVIATRLIYNTLHTISSDQHNV